MSGIYYVRRAQRQRPGHESKYRISWSLAPQHWDPRDDARQRNVRTLLAAGCGGIEYVRGDNERDAYVHALEQAGFVRIDDATVLRKGVPQ